MSNLRPKRQKLMSSQKGLCFYCQQRMWMPKDGKPADNLMATLDHKIPVSEGGGHGMENFVLACSLCNSMRGSIEFETFLNERLWLPENEARRKALILILNPPPPPPTLYRKNTLGAMLDREGLDTYGI